MIPADDPVRLLTAFVEGMDLSELYATYDRVRKNQATPRQMLKIMIYAAMNRLFGKILSLIEECETLYGIKVVYNGKETLRTMKRLRKKLYRIREEEQIAFVYGTGHRKSQLQKSIETPEGYIDKLKEYTKHLKSCCLYFYCDSPFFESLLMKRPH